MDETQIDFEITATQTPYEYARKIIQKILDDHEDERDLRIKVILNEPYLEESSEDCRAACKDKQTSCAKTVEGTLATTLGGKFIVVDKSSLITL